MNAASRILTNVSSSTLPSLSERSGPPYSFFIYSWLWRSLRPSNLGLQLTGCASKFPTSENSNERLRKMLDNPGVGDSFDLECAVSSVVEHLLDTEGVRGSNPLSRTIPVLCPAERSAEREAAQKRQP